jgi:hypothetical protein
MIAESRVVLVINSGSSSLKYQLVDPDSGASRAVGIVEQIGEQSSSAQLDAGKHHVRPGRRTRRGAALGVRPAGRGRHRAAGQQKNKLKKKTKQKKI